MELRSILLIAGMAFPGIFCFDCLMSSIKAERKFWKITYLIAAIIFAAIVIECVLWFTLERISSFKMGFVILMRIGQGLLVLSGILMAIGIQRKKNENLNTG